MNYTILEVKAVSKWFGGLQALKNVDITVEKGEIVGVIGPNGAGKTTLFNCICGLYRPETGSIFLEGKEITGLPPYTICRRGIVRTFQIPRPFSNIDVLRNVTLGALSVFDDISEAREYAMDIIKMLGLNHKMFELGRNLTFLERKRLELARALATKPKVLLMDEVMAGLVSAEIDELSNTIKRLREEDDITFVVVEHVMRVIMGICDRVVVLHHGEKIAEGSPLEIGRDIKVVKAYLGEEYVA